MVEMLDTSNIVAEIGNRLRILERKQYTLSEKILIINQNMIEEYKRLLMETKSIKEDIKDYKKDLFEVQEAVKNIAKEMDGFAKKNSLKVLEKYINLWNPMNFITQKEVIDLIKKGGKNFERI